MKPVLGDRLPFLSGTGFIIRALWAASAICVKIKLHMICAVPAPPPAIGRRPSCRRDNSYTVCRTGRRRCCTPRHLPIVISRKQLNKNTRRGVPRIPGVACVPAHAHGSPRVCAVTRGEEQNRESARGAEGRGRRETWGKVLGKSLCSVASGNGLVAGWGLPSGLCATPADAVAGVGRGLPSLPRTRLINTREPPRTPAVGQLCASPPFRGLLPREGLL